ncbi:type VI secretion system tube protein Hcp [Erwinia sp. AnSW2-5]
METGSGGGSGKVIYRDLTVNAFIDKATSGLMRYVSNGKHKAGHGNGCNI